MVDYPDGSHVITRVLIKRIQEGQNQISRCDEGSEGLSNLWPLSKEFRPSLEGRKGKEIDSLQKGTPSCLYIVDF